MEATTSSTWLDDLTELTGAHRRSHTHRSSATVTGSIPRSRGRLPKVRDVPWKSSQQRKAEFLEQSLHHGRTRYAIVSGHVTGRFVTLQLHPKERLLMTRARKPYVGPTVSMVNWNMDSSSTGYTRSSFCSNQTAPFDRGNGKFKIEN